MVRSAFLRPYRPKTAPSSFLKYPQHHRWLTEMVSRSLVRKKPTHRFMSLLNPLLNQGATVNLWWNRRHYLRDCDMQVLTIMDEMILSQGGKSLAITEGLTPPWSTVLARRAHPSHKSSQDSPSAHNVLITL